MGPGNLDARGARSSSNGYFDNAVILGNYLMTERIFRKTPKPLTRHSAKLRAEILAMLKRGKSQNQISRDLDMSLGTIGYHVGRLRQARLYKG
jgi:DNA-binding NarL/FixJ family response regulator